MKCSKQKNGNRPTQINISGRRNHFKCTDKKSKPAESSVKETVSSMLENKLILTPTSSSSFKLEPIKEFKSLKKTKINSPTLKESNEKKKRNLKSKPKISKVKPFIVKMTSPVSSSHNLITMLDDKRLPDLMEADSNLLKSLTSGCTFDISNIKIGSSNKMLPRGVETMKHKSSGKQSNQKVTVFHQKKLVEEVKNVMPNQKSSCEYPDYFVINSTNSFDYEIAKVFRINDSKFLLSMKPGKLLYFIGIFDLELLFGSVEVLGYSLNKPIEKSLTVYSCQGSSNLFIKASSLRSQSTKEEKEICLKKLISLGLSKATSNKILKETERCVVFLLNRISNAVKSTVWPMFLENHLSFSLFPSVDWVRKESRQNHSVMERSLGCICQENVCDLGYKEYNEVPEWSLIERDILTKDVFKTVLCGGKSVGKSTLLRYLVNKCLQKWESVLVVDFDLGQCEFTPPGCVSVTLVDQPLLGPNYSHLREPLRCVYLGEVDVTKCPESYMKGYKWLIDYAKQEHGNKPWLINTMGFTKGFGVRVACEIIKIVNPSQVVQIESKDWKLNFAQRLDPGFVYSQNTDASSRVAEPLDYNLFVIPSGSESGTAVKSRGLSPAESRNLALLSYLSEMLSSDRLNLSQVVPYRINMDLLELQITSNYSLTKAQIAAAMNGNLVALCSLNESDSFPNCLGFGIVRGIDNQTNTIYLITPLPASLLGEVNCLQKGNIALPESLYFNQGEVEGKVPYLAITSGNATARFAKRDFRSLPATTTAMSAT